jgi:hypothetical protein
VGLLDFVEGRYTLLGEPVLKSELQCLIKAFEDPLARQELLEQVGYEWRSTPHKVQA